MSSQSILERAFELAKSGRCSGMLDIKQKLQSEGYTQAHIGDQLFGPSLTKQLKALCAEARRLVAEA